MTVSKLLSTEDRGNVTVVQLHEKKLYQQAVTPFRAEVLALADAGKRMLVLDLSGVAVMNSSALGVIILLYDRLRKEGGQLALSGLSPILEELFLRMHLNELFPILKTVEEGVQVLQEKKKIPAQ